MNEYMFLAAITEDVFGGVAPTLFDPALGNNRKRREIIQQVKMSKMPHGTGIEGMSFHLSWCVMHADRMVVHIRSFAPATT